MTTRIFGHYIPTLLLALALFETLIFFCSLYLAVALRFLEVDVLAYDLSGQGDMALPRAMVYTLVMGSVMVAFGMYRWDVQRDDRSYQTRYIGALATGALALTLVFYFIPQTFIGRGVMVIALLFSLAGTGAARVVFLSAVGADRLKRRILVLGTGSRAAEVRMLARREGVNARFHIVGFVQLDETQPAIGRDDIIDSKEPLLSLVRRYKVDEIVVGLRDCRGGRLSMKSLLECRLDGVAVVNLSSFFERETGHVQLDSLNPSWIVYSNGFHRTALRNLLKRWFDIVVSSILFMFALPVAVLTALAIFAESGGPIFYKQIRVGQFGRKFEIIKFRSMRQDAEHDGVARWAAANDKRITLVGRFIRATRIDELPQIFNVMRGEMSFVGPRPERPEFVRELTEKIPYYANRHTVKPGITGWAQIRYPYGASVKDAIKKLQFDLYYAKNHTLFLDCIILLQTAQVVLFGRGGR